MNRDFFEAFDLEETKITADMVYLFEEILLDWSRHNSEQGEGIFAIYKANNKYSICLSAFGCMSSKDGEVFKTREEALLHLLITLKTRLYNEVRAVFQYV